MSFRGAAETQVRCRRPDSQPGRDRYGRRRFGGGHAVDGDPTGADELSGLLA